MQSAIEIPTKFDDALTLFGRLSHEELLRTMHYEGVLATLAYHASNSKFLELIKLAKPLISDPLVTKPFFKKSDLKNDGHRLLFKRMYALANEDPELFDPAVFTKVRSKVKKILRMNLPLQKDSEFREKFKEFTKDANKQVEDFVAALATFKEQYLEELDEHGIELGPRISSNKAQLTAYLALKKATLQNKMSFAAIADAIKSNKTNIQNTFLIGKLFSNGLLPCVTVYENNFDNIQKKFVDIFNDAVKSQDSSIHEFCLLDDLFYSLFANLEMKYIYGFAQKFRDDRFFYLMETYRPLELKALLQKEESLVKSKEDRLLRIYYNAFRGNSSENLQKSVNQAERLAHLSHAVAASPSLPVLPNANGNANSKVNGVATHKTAPQRPPSSHNRKVTEFNTKDLFKGNLSLFSATTGSTHSALPVAQNSVATLKEIKDDQVERYQTVTEDMTIAVQILLGIVDSRIKQLLDEATEPEHHIHLGMVDKTPVPETAKKHIAFLPICPIVEGLDDIDLNKDYIQAMKNISESNKGRICFGFINYGHKKTSLHWIPVFMFTPPDGPTQLLIIDPAFEKPSKNNTHLFLKTLFEKYIPGIVVKERVKISQQFNDADCGFAACQTVLDMIEKGAIAIENNQLVLKRDKLSLDGERYIGNEKDFLLCLRRNREDWENRFKGFKDKVIWTLQAKGNFVCSGFYNFELIQKVSHLKRTLETFLSQLTKNFIEVNYGAIELFSQQQINSPTAEQKAELIEKFLKDNLIFNSYCEVLKQFEELRKRYENYSLGELINFSEDTVRQNLAAAIDAEYKTLITRPEAGLPLTRPSKVRLGESNVVSGDNQEVRKGLVLTFEAIDKPLYELVEACKAVRVDADFFRTIDRWRRYLQQNGHNNKQVNLMGFYICEHLIKMLKNQWSYWSPRQYDWNPRTLGGALKDAIAKILNIHPNEVNALNTTSTVKSPITFKDGRHGFREDKGQNTLLDRFERELKTIVIGTDEIRDFSLDLTNKVSLS